MSLSHPLPDAVRAAAGIDIEPPALNKAQTDSANYLQRRGYTLTEIADHLGVERWRVVKRLYDDVVRS